MCRPSNHVNESAVRCRAENEIGASVLVQPVIIRFEDFQVPPGVHKGHYFDEECGVRKLVDFVALCGEFQPDLVLREME